MTVVQDLSIPLDSAKAGEKALSHDGEDYNMTFEDPSVSSSFKLLIPSKTGTDYTIRKSFFRLIPCEFADQLAISGSFD